MTVYLPRMRTAEGVLHQLQTEDPGTQITLCAIRKIIRSGAVPVVPCGRKKLVDYDHFLTYLQSGQTASPVLAGGIRPLPERM